MDQEKVAKFIKEIRKRENLTQKEFASKYGVTFQAVSKWENAKNIPDIVLLKQICDDYHLNLDDFLEVKDSNFKKKKLKICFWLLVVFAFCILFFFFLFHKNYFEFKTLAANCENFNLYGSIAYNENKSSIYISHITYCGEEDNTKYKSLSCTLYETTDVAKIEISHYAYAEDQVITLEEFLENVQFYVNNYENSCKVYKENTLFLEIEALQENGKITTYKIPLHLKDNC